MRRFVSASVIGSAFAVLIAAPGSGASTVAAPPVGALRSLPAPPQLPAGYVQLAGRAGAHVGISQATAVRRTRMLLSDVTGLPLYAFAGNNSQVCIAVWRGGGTCGTLNRTHDSVWLVNGGSQKRGKAVVGVVSDGVRAVIVTLGARTVRATVHHNAFVVPYRTKAGATKPIPRVTTIR